MGHHAAAVVPVPGVVGLIPGVDQHLIPHAVAVDGGEAGALAHQVGDPVQEFLGAVGVDPDGQAGLVALDLLGGLQGHEGDGVGAVPPLPGLAPHGEVLELVVPGEVVGGVGGDGPHPLGVLQPQGVDELLGEVRGDGVLLQIGLIVGVHVLVEPAGVEGQGVFRQDAPHLDEPQKLDGLVEALGGILGDSPAVGGDLPELGGPAGVLFRLSHLVGGLGVPVGVADDALGGQEDGFIEVLFLQVLGVRGVQGGDVGLRLPEDAPEALFEQHVLVVGGDLPHGLPPLGVVVQDAGVHADLPGVLGEPGQEGLLQGFALPVGEDLLPDEGPLLVGHEVGVLGPGGEGIHLPVHPQPGELGGEDAALAELPDGPHHQLAGEDMDLQPVAAVIEGLGPADGHGLALGGLVGFGPDLGPLGGDLGLCVDVILPDGFDTWCEHRRSSFMGSPLGGGFL